MKIETIAGPRLGVGEGAVWDAEGQALFLLDIFGHKVLRHDPASGDTRDWHVDGHVGALALRSGGALLAMGDTIRRMDFATGATEALATNLFDGADVLVNDGTVDARGRFLFGGCSAGIDNPRPIGGLFRLDPDGTVVQLDRGIHQSNSHCFAPDGRTLYAADSYLDTLYAYDYDPETGSVLGRRPFAVTTDLGGCPDGSATSTDGRVWVSLFKAGKVAVYRPDGTLEQLIPMPVKLISSVAWGGGNLDQLFVTTIDPAQFGWPSEGDLAGCTFVISGLDARGSPEPHFAG